MKEKIFQALKQEFTHLGLGDEILTAQAESLASTGLVTEENLKSVVASQKAILEAMQKDNDRRVSAALAKTKKEHDDALKADGEKLAALQAEIDKLKKADDKGDDKRSELEKLLDSRLESVNETIKKLTDANKVYETKIKTMQDEKDAAEKAASSKARKERIAQMAKEKGIPEWLAAHGFADIAEDATDEQIETALSGYAQEIKTNFLPKRDWQAQPDGTKATKADTDAMVKKLNL